MSGPFVTGAGEALPLPSGPAPLPSPSLSDIISAHWTKGKQDELGSHVAALHDAYAPVLQQLDQANPDTRSAIERLNPRYRTIDVDRPHGGYQLDTDAIWRDIAKVRAKDPAFLKDVPAKDAASFDAWVQQGELSRRRQAQGVVNRQSGIGQSVIGFGADLATGMTDPINLGTMAFAGPASGAAKTIWGVMARDALINGAIETVEQPAVAENRWRFGEDYGAGDAVKSVAIAAGGGALFGGAFHLGGKAWEKFRGKSDAEVADAFEAKVPPDQRTPDQQAALDVIRRQDEVDGVRPFVDTPAGRDAHADRLNGAIEAVEHALSLEADPPAPAPRNVPRGNAAGEPLTRDSIIHFVLTHLEGGAAIAHFTRADGGLTKFGISSADHPGVDVANLTEDQAAAIAREKYWFPELDHVDPRTAAVAFDAGWAMGPAAGKKLLREATIGGGDTTQRALAMYRAELEHIADTVPGKAKFKDGWNNRVDKLARRLAGVDDALPFLDPSRFEDEESWRAAQDALDAETLAMEGRHTAPDQLDVSSYVDRYLAGGGKGDTPLDLAMQDFALEHGPEIQAEFERRGAQMPPEAATEGEAAPAASSDVSRETSRGTSAEAPPVEPLRATVKPDAVDDTLLSSAFVAPVGKPGFHIEDEGGDGHILLSVFRDEQGRAKGVVRFPATPEGRRPLGPNDPYTVGISTYVDPAYRRKGIATKLYDQLRAAGHDIDALSGTEDLTPDGAAFVTARRTAAAQRLAARLDAARDRADLGTETGAPLQDDPNAIARDAEAFDRPDGPAAKATADSLEHDLRMTIEAEGDELSLEEALAAARADLEAVEKVRACMAPPAAGGAA